MLAKGYFWLPTKTVDNFVGNCVGCAANPMSEKDFMRCAYFLVD